LKVVVGFNEFGAEDVGSKDMVGYGVVGTFTVGLREGK
jgi:hypothetical protein